MLASTISAAAAIYLFAFILALAPGKPQYSHIKHTISELGEVGAPRQQFVAFGLFLPVGVMLLVVAYRLFPASEAAAALALCIAIGYLVAVAFPCDPGSPVTGSARQGIHNLGGAIEYIGGGFALMALAETLGQPFKAAGFVVLGTAVALTILPANSVRGAVQRVGELGLFASLALAGWQLEPVA